MSFVALIGAAMSASVLTGRVQAAPPAAAPPPGQATYTAVELVDGYENALKPFEHVTYSAESRALIRINDTPRAHADYAGVQEDAQGRGVYRSFVRRDGNRLDILSLRDGVKPGPSAWRDPKLHRERVIVDGGPLILDYSNTTDRLKDAVIGRRTPKGFAVGDSLRTSMHVDGVVAELDGCVSGRHDKPLPEILRDAADLRVRPEPELIDTHRTFVLECTDQDAGYRYTVCIDPDAGFHPRRIVQTRLDPKTDGADVTVDHIEIKKIGAVFVPVAARSSCTHRAGPDYVYTKEAEHTRTDFDFGPDFAKLLAFKMLAPAGIYARNEDDPVAGHRWKFEDGQFILTPSGAAGGAP